MKLNHNKQTDVISISSDGDDCQIDDGKKMFKTPEQFENETQKNLKDFSALLDSLSSLHDKKTALWKQIYENAVFDRRNSYLMWTDLYQKVHGDKGEHMVHGMTLSKYMERCNKANEQIIKLAEILDTAIEDDVDNLSNEDELYKQLEDSNS